MTEKSTKVWATKPFYWDGKNYDRGDSLTLAGTDLIWMLSRGAVSKTEVKADSKPAAGKGK